MCSPGHEIDIVSILTEMCYAVDNNVSKAYIPLSESSYHLVAFTVVSNGEAAQINYNFLFKLQNIF